MKMQMVAKMVILFLFVSTYIIFNTSVLADTKAPSAKKNNGGQTTSADSPKLDDFFSVAGKPVTVWLIPGTAGTWVFKLKSDIEGAVARVKMSNGIVIEMTIKAQKDKKTGNIQYALGTKLSDEEATVTVRKLPNGKIAPVMLSERLYGNRFRVVWEMLASGGYQLYLIEDMELLSKKLAVFMASV